MRRHRWPHRRDRDRHSTRNADRRFASSVCTQSTWVRHAGPFHCSHRSSRLPAKYAACRSRAVSRSAASASRSSANVRIVSYRLYRVRTEPWWALTKDLRTKESRSRSTSMSSLVSATAHRCRQVEPPCEHRHLSQLLPARPRSTGRRTRPSRAAVSPDDRAPAPARSAAGTGQRAGPAPRPRSSPPCVRRPARCQGVARRASRRSRSPRPRSACRRSRTRAGQRGHAPTNRLTASDVTPPSRVKGDTDRRVSPDADRCSRDVARIRGTSERARISSIAAAAAARTCSQLSTRISSRRPATASRPCR